jgi:hypothetical protein
MHTEVPEKSRYYHTVVLVPLTERAKKSIQREKLEVKTFPFRFGRESRHPTQHVPPHILEKRTGKIPPNNDFYMIDDGELLNISREHFLIEQSENGDFLILDRMSSCGTIVRKKQGPTFTCIARQCTISDGDEITIGTSSSPYKFKVEIMGAAGGT